MVIAARPLTYEDLQATPEGDGNRYELLGGELIVTASPSKRHIWLVNLITFELTAFTRARGLGGVFSGPVDVRLSPNDIVVPDIIFLRADRMHVFGERLVDGPPDLIVEVLSPSTRARDLTTKLQLYARTGVPEYWIVDPETTAVSVYVLSTHGGYDLLEPVDGKIRSRALAGLDLDPANFFAGIP